MDCETSAPLRSATVAMLLSCDSFESFFGRVLNLNKTQYLESYRNDWSWYYAKGLSENGVRPILYVPSLREAGRHETEIGDVRFLPLAAWYKWLAPLRRAFRISRWTLYAQERINAAALMQSLRSALTEDGADLLYVQEYWSGRFDHLAHRSPVPVVAADHGGVAEGIVHTFKRRAMQRARVLYGQTRDECRKIEKSGGRSAFQPNGCDLTMFSQNQSVARGKTILTVARLTDKQKRTSDLIRALPHVSSDWTLDIVGQGPDKTKLMELADALGVRHRVTFHGFVSRQAVLQHVRRCGVYAMPSANEAVALAVLEAMGCGAAVVATRIRSFEQLIDDGVSGRLIPVGDPRALAAAIEQAWTDRAELGAAAARAVSTNYDNKRLHRHLADSLLQATGFPTAQVSNSGEALA